MNKYFEATKSQINSYLNDSYTALKQARTEGQERTAMKDIKYWTKQADKVDAGKLCTHR